MDFELTPQEQETWERAKAFAQEHLAPHAARWDREETFPEEACIACARHGLTGLTVPKEVGGPGASTVAYALTIQELAAACSSTAVTVAVSSMVAETLAHFGTPQQHERYVRPLLNGSFTSGSFALSEPSSGSDAASLQTKARQGDEGFLVHGEKTWITSGTHSGVFVVWAKTNEHPGAKGISTILLEPSDAGFSVGRKEDKLGLRASTTVSLHFEDCKVPADRLLGTEGRGFRTAMKALDGGRIGIASQALGIARSALDTVHAYLEAHPNKRADEQHARLAALGVRWRAARLLTLRAAWLKDQKRLASHKAAMAKAYSSEVANEICQAAVELLGEDGCSDAYPVERLFRDCKVTTIYEGTSEVQRIVISRAYLRDQA